MNYECLFKHSNNAKHSQLSLEMTSTTIIRRTVNSIDAGSLINNRLSLKPRMH